VLYLILALLANASVSVIHLVAKYVSVLRGMLRRLAKPLQYVASVSAAKGSNLPAPKTHFVSTKEVSMTTSEGVELFATLYFPVEPDHDSEDHTPELEEHHKFGTILVRTPYGRHQLGAAWATIFAEQGYAVVLQDTRGRFGSSGDFFPILHEKKDGAETIKWIVDQPWSNGDIALFGVSYLGLTAYASAGGEAQEHVKAVIPVMSSAETYSLIYHTNGGCVSLDLVLRWLWLVVKLQESLAIIRFWIPALQSELNEALLGLPLKSQDAKLLGSTADFLQQALSAPRLDDPFWEDTNMLCDLSSETRPPTHIVGGWYDFFLRQSFHDYQNARKVADKSPISFTIGPWSHWDITKYRNASLKLSLDFLAVHMSSEENTAGPGKPRAGFAEDNYTIHVAVIGTSPTTWLGFESWPPAESAENTLLLQDMLPNQREVTPDFLGYVYDPADPTPSIGGPSFNPHNSGPLDQAELEARSDVLVYTSPPQTSPLYVAGDVYVDLYATSDNPFTDFFVKLCSVNEKGYSVGVVEGLHRMEPDLWDSAEPQADGSTTYVIRRRLHVGATAVVFAPGHSVRLQISGGAHPLYMRNYGTGHCIKEGTELRSATHHIFSSSKLLLPVLQPEALQAHTTPHPAFS